MPVNKKPKKESVKKKAPKKRIDTQKKVKEDIKEAVNKLPGLIIEQVKFENQMQKKSEELNEAKVSVKKFTRPPVDNNEKTKKRLMWLFVFIITAVVFSMWFWNMTVMFKDVGKNKNTNNLLGNVKTNYEEIMNSNLTKDNKKEEVTDTEKNEIKNSIKESLGSLLANITTTTNNITTSSSSTIDGEINSTTTSLENL